MARRERPGSRRGRHLAGLGLLALLLLGAGWSGLWLYARAQAEAGLRNWIAAERVAGRLWACSSLQIGGYPTSIVVRCDGASFSDAGDPTFKGGLAGLRARARLPFPTEVVVDLLPPLSIQDRAIDNGLTATWSAARLVLRGDLPGDLSRGTLEAERVAITGGGRAGATRIGHGSIGYRPLSAAGPQAVDAALVATVADASDPDAEAAFGAGTSIALDMRATVRKLPLRGVALPVLLEAWRGAGGSLELDQLRFTAGPFRVEGTGRLAIDEVHRPQGQVDARFTGLAPVAARFGVPMAALNVGSLLSGLLGGKQAAPQSEAGDLTLPLVARGGHLYLGPIKTGIALPPLY